MNQLTVNIRTHGNVSRIPVNVEVLDHEARILASRWLDSRREGTFELSSGVYRVRATLPSGRTFRHIVEIKEGQDARWDIPAYKISPHETHEWAYLTRDINPSGARLFSEGQYAGTWVRRWSLETYMGAYTDANAWGVEALANPQDLFANEDGVSFSIFSGGAPTLLQVGGDAIPWKFVAIPPDRKTMVLLRATKEGPHPLEIAICSTDWELESLLSLLNRSSVDRASSLLESEKLVEIAEDKLRGKVVDPYGAVIGGYALLRLKAHEQMHNWPRNLANWFESIPDGAVIHAWQLIEQARKEPDPENRQELVGKARTRLLEAESRGLPLITEGLFRLRDGLLMFLYEDQTRLKEAERGGDPDAIKEARGDLAEIKAALARIGGYTAAAERHSSFTSFTGASPTRPTPEPPTGPPDDGGEVSYVFDVPLIEAVESGALPAGTRLTTRRDDGQSCVVNAKGEIVLEDGRTFPSMGAMLEGTGQSTQGAMNTWFVTSDGPQSSNQRALGALVGDMRFVPKAPRKRARQTVYKSDLIKKVAEETGVSASHATAAVNAVFDAISSTVAKGKKVVVRDFGTFERKTRKGRKGRNPNTKKEIDIPSKFAAHFSPSKSLKRKVEHS